MFADNSAAPCLIANFFSASLVGRLAAVGTEPDLPLKVEYVGRDVPLLVDDSLLIVLLDNFSNAINFSECSLVLRIYKIN